MKKTHLIIPLVALAQSLSQTAAADNDNCDMRSDSPDHPFSVLLRNDFNDFGPLSCTRHSVSAQGATVSGADNLLTNQNSALVDGLLAVVHTHSDPSPAATLMGYSVGAYVQGNDTYQFQPTSTQQYNGDTVTPGAYGEIALRNPINELHGFDNFRLHGGEAFASTGTRSDSLVAEWIPAYSIARYLSPGEPQRIGTSPLSYVFSPELMVQYDHFEGGPKTATLFSSRFDALRVGPQFVLQLRPNEKITSVAGGDFFAGSSLVFTNHESWDEYTGKEYMWTSVAWNYTFKQVAVFGLPADLSPHFGLSVSYGFGNSEQTGNLTKQFKIGLAAKL
jgi:hypothetical protein